ncbi:MAG: PspC domain-containing protein [Cyclobacteriaceae bacterium]|nr:PspC domain-containing protein [Cyclobacteriaceae bacterium]
MEKRLTRSRNERMIAGVCGGIAEFYKLDPSLVRIGIVVIGFITALIPMCILYAVMWAIVPEEV